MAHITYIRTGQSAAEEKSFSNIAISFLTTGGVVATNDYLVQAQASPNNTVLVNTGRAFIPTSDGSMVYATHLDATQNVPIASNASGSTQIDSIVLYIDLSASPTSNADNVAKFADVRGTGGVAPNNSQILTAIGASNPYIILANISVANGFSSITSGNITDKRTSAKLGSTSGLLQSIQQTTTLSNPGQNGTSDVTLMSLTFTPTATANLLVQVSGTWYISNPAGKGYIDIQLDGSVQGNNPAAANETFTAINSGNSQPFSAQLALTSVSTASHTIAIGLRSNSGSYTITVVNAVLTVLAYNA